MLDPSERIERSERNVHFRVNLGLAMRPLAKAQDFCARSAQTCTQSASFARSVKYSGIAGLRPNPATHGSQHALCEYRPAACDLRPRTR